MIEMETSLRPDWQVRPDRHVLYDSLLQRFLMVLGVFCLLYLLSDSVSFARTALTYFSFRYVKKGIKE